MDTQRRNIKEIVDKLVAEPLTHLMLGHRELFHSNLLAWFFEFLPVESDVVFGKLTKESNNTNESRKVRREKSNLDLWFCWPNRHPLVIENKVFSLPNTEQLKKYTAEKHVENALFCLLSLSNPNWENGQLEIEHHKWRWLSFRELGELIRYALPSGNHSYEVETMRRYVGVVSLLHELAAGVAVMNSSETVRLPDDVKTALADNRLMSSMAKLRASCIEQCVRQALHAAGVAQTNVKTDLTHGEPLNDWFSSISNEWEAGWQVQGGMFLLAIRQLCT